MGSRVLLLLPYNNNIVWACVTSSDIIPYGILGYNTMERHCGQYSVTNCRCNVGLSVQCSCVRCSKIDASTFEDRCVDLRRSMIDVLTFEDRCKIMLLHVLKTLIL